MNPAQLLLEKVFGLALNPGESYFAQLSQAIGSSGELSNKSATNEVLLELCKMFDAQEKRLKALEEEVGRIEAAKPVSTLQPDPTVPLDATSTSPTGQNTNPTV